MASAWRIVRQPRATTAFTGEGARLFGGRWSSPGVAVVYVSEHQSTAALEILVHALPWAPEKFKAFQLEWPDKLTEIYPLAQLPADWRRSPPSQPTMQIGDRWVREQRSAVLALPSAISPADLNYLLNPAHPDFGKIRISKPQDYDFDPRLLSAKS